MKQCDLSIIVASYNTKQLLQGCLQSIYQNTQGLIFEVIVVDDGSKDESPGMVRKLFPQVRLICNEHNLKYVGTNNVGLLAASGRYGLLLNSDVEVKPGTFVTLVRFMDAHPDAAAAGPKLINPDGSIQHCIRSFAGVFPMICQTLNLHKLWPNNSITNRYYYADIDYDRLQVVPHIGTAAFIIRRQTWETFGLLDERFEQFFGDFAYCYMLGQHNQKIYYIPEAVVMHYGSQSINQSGIKQIRALHEALRKFYDIYYAPRYLRPIRWVVRIGIRMREFFKVLEFRLSRDKRVITGPGAPPLTRSS
ncbi:MAG: glycosyltransferase family 2 protein [Alphaproteobacteria bacterium]|nr:glycosyltransferase family 2 protein [Alphaproteobacteria bacterium]